MATIGVVRVRRVYDEPDEDDGLRILVDRIWPRGMTKARAALDEWCKDVAPSTELRKWYSHDAARFEEFSAALRRRASTSRSSARPCNACETWPPTVA